MSAAQGAAAGTRRDDGGRQAPTLDVVVCWRLDRLGRNLRHLITMLDELRALGIAFVSLAEGIDATTPAGKLQLHILAAIAEFERGRIQERVMAGLARARAQGKRLGRPKAASPDRQADRREVDVERRSGQGARRVAGDDQTLAGGSENHHDCGLTFAPVSLALWMRRAGSGISGFQ